MKKFRCTEIHYISDNVNIQLPDSLSLVISDTEFNECKDNYDEVSMLLADRISDVTGFPIDSFSFYEIFDYSGQNVYVKEGSYGNPKSIALILFLENDFCVDVISENLKSKLQNETGFFLNIHRFPGMEEFLAKNKIARKTKITRLYQGRKYPYFKLFI